MAVHSKWKTKYLTLANISTSVNILALMGTLFVLQKKGALSKKGKKIAANPLSTKKVEAKKYVNPLFEKRPRNFRIGEFSQAVICHIPTDMMSCIVHLTSHEQTTFRLLIQP